MSAPFTVIMPTIPERADLFAEALESVQRQTFPVEYRVGMDTDHNGPIPTVNALAGCVETEWLFRLDDDDLLDPDHFAILNNWLDDADIVYTWCRVEGGTHPEDFFQKNFHVSHLREANWIPCSAAVRTQLWHDLGGLQASDWTDHEDWDFWVRALDAGARFRCVPAVTWTYRLNTEWEHRSTNG
jgi:glycosyltransferase involved in cell wall biosynthesis